jgi:hypothetical protein
MPAAHQLLIVFLFNLLSLTDGMTQIADDIARRTEGILAVHDFLPFNSVRAPPCSSPRGPPGMKPAVIRRRYDRRRGLKPAVGVVCNNACSVSTATAAV